MIPFLLIAGGAYLLGSAMHVKKLSLGDYLEDKPIEAGDEVVFQFNDDTWLEIYEDEEFPTSEISFPAGEAFEVVVFDMDAGHYHVKFNDGSIAFIPKGEVTVVAVNDEIAAFKNGGKIKSLSKRLSQRPRRSKYFANDIIKQGGKFVVTLVDTDDKVVRKKSFDKLEDAQVYKINYNNPDERVGTKAGYLKLNEVVNVNGEKAYVGPGNYSKYEGYFENYDEWPIVHGETKEEVIQDLHDQLENPPPFREYYER